MDRFDEPERIRRRIRPRDEMEEDFYRPRRTSRAAIPERAASRRPDPEDWDSPRRPSRPPEDLDNEAATPRSRYSAGSSRPSASEFGARRRERESGAEVRRGSRPAPSADVPRSSRRPSGADGPMAGSGAAPSAPAGPPGVPQGTPIRSRGGSAASMSDADYTPVRRTPSPPQGGGEPSRPRDNSSRFDD